MCVCGGHFSERWGHVLLTPLLASGNRRETPGWRGSGWGRVEAREEEGGL